jgi:hypothetical protein
MAGKGTIVHTVPAGGLSETSLHDFLGESAPLAHARAPPSEDARRNDAPVVKVLTCTGTRRCMSCACVRACMCTCAHVSVHARVPEALP